MFDLELECQCPSGGKGKGKGEKGDFHSPTSHTPFLIFDRWSSTASLIQISFSPHRSAAVENKDGGLKNTELARQNYACSPG